MSRNTPRNTPRRPPPRKPTLEEQLTTFGRPIPSKWWSDIGKVLQERANITSSGFIPATPTGNPETIAEAVHRLILLAFGNSRGYYVEFECCMNAQSIMNKRLGEALEAARVYPATESELMALIDMVYEHEIYEATGSQVIGLDDPDDPKNQCKLCNPMR